MEHATHPMHDDGSFFLPRNLICPSTSWQVSVLVVPWWSSLERKRNSNGWSRLMGEEYKFCVSLQINQSINGTNNEWIAISYTAADKDPHSIPLFLHWWYVSTVDTAFSHHPWDEPSTNNKKTNCLKNENKQARATKAATLKSYFLQVTLVFERPRMVHKNCDCGFR